MEIIYIILTISIISNIVLSIGVRNLIKQNEELEDTLIEVVEGTRTRVETALQQMKDIDTREVFEKDDEVGATFEQLKNIIEDLNQEL
jgi:HPt (histidine-containing phosphotransfer) domain-containing protein